MSEKVPESCACSVVDTCSLSETDKAWMAGFVDGEGCITISKQVRKNRPTPAYRVFITISNTDYAVLEFFKLHYGGSIYNVHERRKDKRNIKWSDTYDWYCPISSSKRFLRDILPYLRLKRKQAELCLEFLETRKNTKQARRINGTLAGSEGLTVEELNKRESYRLAVRALNSKGQYARIMRGYSYE